MEHTPEPWGRVGALIRAPDGNRTIATVWGEGLRGSQQEADARRIVACVNGCQGINPEAVPDLLAALEKVEWLHVPHSDGTWLYCPWCKQYEAHADDCPRQAALARARGEQ